METIMTPQWGVSWGEMALILSAIKSTKCFLCFLLVTVFFGWFKVYFKQPIGSWLQKCNPHLYNLDNFLLSNLDQICFIECSRARMFWYFGHNLKKRCIWLLFIYCFVILCTFDVFWSFHKNVLHDDLVHTLLMHGDLCSNVDFSSMLWASFDMIVLVVSYFTLA